MALALDKVSVRAKLSARREPYWSRLERGLYLGFRRTTDGGTWVGRWLDEDGQRHFHALGHADRIDYDAAAKAARQWAKREVAGIATRHWTVAEVCREQVADKWRTRGGRYAKDAEGRFKRYVYPVAIGKVRLDRLRTRQVEEWRDGLPMGPASKNRMLTALRAALNAAVRSHYVELTQAVEWRNVKLCESHGRRMLYLDKAERQALLAALPDSVRPFVRCLCLLPLRPGALASCTVGDFDRRAGTLRIPHDKTKPATGRIIPLSEAALGLLREQTRGKLPGAPLISYTDGSHWSRFRWRDPIQRAARAAHLPPATCCYTLRHSVLTDMLTAGTDSMTVAKVAGTSMTMLEKFYAHILGKHAAEALQRLAL